MPPSVVPVTVPSVSVSVVVFGSPTPTTIDSSHLRGDHMETGRREVVGIVREKEFLLRHLLSINPYRCKDCDVRYFRFRHARARIENQRHKPA